MVVGYRGVVGGEASQVHDELFRAQLRISSSRAASPRASTCATCSTGLVKTR